MDIAVQAQALSFLATLVVAAVILYRGREARGGRNDEDRQLPGLSDDPGR
jgi:hypothetical protein